MIQKLLHRYLQSFPIDYGKYRLAAGVHVPPLESYLAQTAEGIRMDLDLREYVMKQIYLYGWYEKNTVQHLLRMVQPHWNVADVGANIGFYALTLAKHVPDGNVHAFEPNPHTLEKLRKNISLNPFRNIQVHPFALGAAEGFLDMTFSEGNLGTASAYRADADVAIRVPVTTLDAFCEKAGLEQIHLIKADIEGGEKFLLEGARNTFRRNPEMILVVELMEETCSAAGYHAADLFKEILGMGFRAFIPRPWPFGLTRTYSLPENYLDNIIFIRN